MTPYWTRALLSHSELVEGCQNTQELDLKKLQITEGSVVDCPMLLAVVKIPTVTTE